jgi:riboflavin kinase/FMN adenylyltransferase
MEHFNSIFEINIETPTAITIGKFDGIHKGHHELISEIISKKALGLYSCLITFKKSPRFILSKDITPNLFTNEERDYILEQRGINYLIVNEFNKKFMELDAIKFIEILCKNLNMKFLAVGEDFTFGYKGSGNVELLKKLSRKYGFELKVFNKIKKDKKCISSTLIREELIKGNIKLVNEMLGYEYFIFGQAIFEKNIKNKIPSLYIIPSKEKLIPKFGIYYTKIIFEGNVHYGISRIGKKMRGKRGHKFENEILIETFINEYIADLNEKKITIFFLKILPEI